MWSSNEFQFLFVYVSADLSKNEITCVIHILSVGFQLHRQSYLTFIEIETGTIVPIEKNIHPSMADLVAAVKIFI